MRLLAASVVALVSVACGGAGAPAKTAPGAPMDEEDAPAGYGQPGAQPGYSQEHQPQQYPSTDSTAKPVGPTGPFAEEPPMTLDEAILSLDQAGTALSNAGSDCAKACKALASMERSKERICELNGPDDPGDRCEKARDRVEAARELLGRRCGNCDS